MALNREDVSTVTFDSYSTLLNVDAIGEALTDLSADAAAVARLWRARSLDYARICNFLSIYEPFYKLNRKALEYALECHGVNITAEKREEILSVYHELPVFDDVYPGFEALSDAGYDLWILSNGNPAMLDSLIEQASVGEFVEGTISADEVERYKPDADLYRHTASVTDSRIDETIHVTAGWVDVMGAANAGMQTVWVDRRNEPWEMFGCEPDLTVETIDEVVHLLA